MNKISKRLIALLLVVMIVCAGSSVFAIKYYEPSAYQQFDNLCKQISNLMKRLYTIFDYANVRNINVFEYDFIREGEPMPPEPPGMP